MSASRDRAILFGGGMFTIGFISGVFSLVWLLNRKLPEDDPDYYIPPHPRRPWNDRTKPEWNKASESEHPPAAEA